MPKPTFYNLPQDKQTYILGHAVQEFARHPYEQASLSEIVSRAGIAKGSMYQYFEDKADLYKYVVNHVYQHKREFLRPIWDKKNIVDFFDFASMYYRRTWHFARNHPDYHRVTVNFWESRDDTLRDEILREKQMRNTEFADMLELGCQSQVIAAETDKEAAWFVYHAVAKSLIDNFLTAEVSTDFHEAFINSVLSILELGLRPRKE